MITDSMVFFLTPSLSLCCDGGYRVGLLFIAFLEERDCVEKIVRIRDRLVSTFFSMQALKSNST
jgi:hypothetical protein